MSSECPLDEFEANLLSRLQGQKPMAWDEFFAHFSEQIEGVPRWPKWQFSPEDRADVSQEIRVALVKAIPGYKQRSTLKHYVRRVSIYQCINYLRRKVRTPQHAYPTSSSEPNPIDHVASKDDLHGHLNGNEMLDQVNELLAELDPTCQQALTLFYFKGKKYREIAEELGLSVGTICGRMAKCTAKLQKSARARAVFQEFFNPEPTRHDEVITG